MKKDYEKTLISLLADRWWIAMIRGLVAILFGVMALAAPELSLFTLVMIWGVYAIADGLINLTMATREAKSGESWGWLLAEGLVSLAAGALTFFWPGITAMTLLIVIGIWAIASGVARIIAAIQLRRLIRGEWLLAASGILTLAFGGFVLMYPRQGALAVIWIIGAHAIALGALLMAFGLRLLNWHRGERRMPLRST